ncbi:hypothetical protein C0992_006322 [Termitomyces sp. T32_za158]|nr:hypothetical protein C0992_006322 [Termitomyces sp. T32_za158]
MSNSRVLGNYDATELSKVEIFWRDHYDFLKERGYTLRKRYDPAWVPSWLNTTKKPRECEDRHHIPHGQALDATRTDNTLVVLKRVDIDKHANEILVAKHLSSATFVSDPRNHCVPVLEVIEPRESSRTAFIVMPLLLRFDMPPFETIGEAVGFCKQIFEGLHYLHENNIAHGDCKSDNILSDSLCLFDSPPHPARESMKRDYSAMVSNKSSRTLKPVKYYFVDFGLTKIYQPEDAPFLEQPPWGGDKTVPEHLIPSPPLCDPFAVDVYCLGNFLRQYFLDGLDGVTTRPPPQGFEFLRGLVTDMVNTDPIKRPQMSKVVCRFDTITSELKNRRLRSPFIRAGDRLGIFDSAVHWSKQLFRMVRGIPAIPVTQ